MASKFKLLYAALFVAFAVPFTSHAVLTQTSGLIREARTIINFLIPAAAALALLFFFWGLAKFILHADSEDERESGKEIMKWGIVALFVMVSIWGIVLWLRTELGVTYTGDSRVPGFTPAP